MSGDAHLPFREETAPVNGAAETAWDGVDRRRFISAHPSADIPLESRRAAVQFIRAAAVASIGVLAAVAGWLAARLQH